MLFRMEGDLEIKDSSNPGEVELQFYYKKSGKRGKGKLLGTATTNKWGHYNAAFNIDAKKGETYDFYAVFPGTPASTSGDDPELGKSKAKAKVRVVVGLRLNVSQRSAAR